MRHGHWKSSDHPLHERRQGALLHQQDDVLFSGGGAIFTVIGGVESRGKGYIKGARTPRGAARVLTVRVYGLSLRRELFTRQTDAARQGEAFIYKARRERRRRAVPRRPGQFVRVHPRDRRDALRFGRVAEAAGRGRA